MNKQTSLSAFDDELTQVRSKKKVFLAKKDRIIPWRVAHVNQTALLQKENAKTSPTIWNGCSEFIFNKSSMISPMNAASWRLLTIVPFRILVSEFEQSDPQRRYPRQISQSIDCKRTAGKALFTQVVKMLMAKGLILEKRTVVDSTIIDALSSIKNKNKARDPEGKSTKKGNTWYFGYKAHIGVDNDSGFVHTVVGTSENEHDVTQNEKI